MLVPPLLERERLLAPVLRPEPELVLEQARLLEPLQTLEPGCC